MIDPRAQPSASTLEPIQTLLDRAGIIAHYRPDTSDERVLREVLFTSPYRRKRLGFEVEAGEKWLDLGANIGAFVIYCRWRGATVVEAYEPDLSCFTILRQNTTSETACYCVAVTASREPSIPFWRSKTPTDHHRATAFGMKRAQMAGMFANFHGEFLLKRSYDGVKMDIEGSECGLLDAGYIPQCEKLVLEYHTWRDPSTENLHRRIDFLRSKFKVVHYPPEYDRMLQSGYKETTTYYDRTIYCMGRKS